MDGIFDANTFDMIMGLFSVSMKYLSIRSVLSVINQILQKLNMSRGHGWVWGSSVYQWIPHMRVEGIHEFACSWAYTWAATLDGTTTVGGSQEVPEKW